MHVPPPGALGPYQAIAVAWVVDGRQLGVNFQKGHTPHLMETRIWLKEFSNIF